MGESNDKNGVMEIWKRKSNKKERVKKEFGNCERTNNKDFFFIFRRLAKLVAIHIHCRQMLYKGLLQDKSPIEVER